MMALPPGFDVSLLVADFMEFALPVIGVAGLIFAAVSIFKILRRA